jgi:hypothetical protein
MFWQGKDVRLRKIPYPGFSILNHLYVWIYFNNTCGSQSFAMLVMFLLITTTNTQNMATHEKIYMHLAYMLNIFEYNYRPGWSDIQSF